MAIRLIEDRPVLRLVDDIHLAAWDSGRHPRWPKGTPEHGGEFMKLEHIFDAIKRNVSGSVDLTFLAHGENNVDRVVASGRGGSDDAVIQIHHKGGKVEEVPLNKGQYGGIGDLVHALSAADSGGVGKAGSV